MNKETKRTIHLWRVQGGARIYWRATSDDFKHDLTGETRPGLLVAMRQAFPEARRVIRYQGISSPSEVAMSITTMFFKMNKKDRAGPRP